MAIISKVTVGIVLCFGLQACARRSVTLIHPGTGASARCEEEAYGVLAANVGVLIENCIKEHEAKGYLPMEKLTSQQRSELERRGLMPRPAAPMGY